MLDVYEIKIQVVLMTTTEHRILAVHCDGHKSSHHVTEHKLTTIFKYLLKCYTNHEIISVKPFSQCFRLQTDKNVGNWQSWYDHSMLQTVINVSWLPEA